jgi:hypothetical protein
MYPSTASLASLILCVAGIALAEEAEPKVEGGPPKNPPPALVYVKDVNVKEKTLIYMQFKEVMSVRVVEERVQEGDKEVIKEAPMSFLSYAREERVMRYDVATATSAGGKALGDDEWAKLKGQMIVISQGDLDPAYADLFARRTVLVKMPGRAAGERSKPARPRP